MHGDPGKTAAAVRRPVSENMRIVKGEGAELIRRIDALRTHIGGDPRCQTGQSGPKAQDIDGSIADGAQLAADVISNAGRMIIEIAEILGVELK